MPAEREHHPVAEEPRQEGRRDRHRDRLRPRGRAHRQRRARRSCARSTRTRRSRARGSRRSPRTRSSARSPSSSRSTTASRRPASRARTSTWSGARCSRATSRWPSSRGFGNVQSAGRVQTPTLELIVEREREREAFVPETTGRSRARFAARRRRREFARRARDRPLQAPRRPQRVMAAVAGATSGTVTAVERKKRTGRAARRRSTRPRCRRPRPPRGITPARTMRIAESLYMDGLISYPRVDNTVYPPSLDLTGILDALAEVPVVPRARQQRSSAGRAARRRAARRRRPTTRRSTRPARPTPTSSSPRSGSSTTSSRAASWRRCRTPAIIEGTKVTIDVAGEPFVARGDVLVDAGLPRDLPVRPEEGRAAAGAGRGRRGRLPRRRAGRRSRPQPPVALLARAS